MIEIETKIVGIDNKEVKGALSRLHAELVGRFLQRRWVFDISPSKEVDEFIRVRTDGKKTTLTYKRREGSGMSNTYEVETEVEDFNKAAEILSKVMRGARYQENYRELYRCDGLEVAIDHWPMIKPHLEVEGPSEEEVKDLIRRLRIRGKEVGNVSVVKIYAGEGIDLNSFKELRFSKDERKELGIGENGETE
jgi:predicted adenylyl cyclase CyaB